MGSESKYEEFWHPQWPIFYLDNHVLALYKPAGLLVQADRTGDVDLLTLAKAWIKRRFNKPGRAFVALVHRLDRPVAGVLVLARTSKAASRLSEQFRKHQVTKEYVAVVEGVPPRHSALLRHYLVKSPTGSMKVRSRPDKTTQEAVLEYTVVGAHGGRSLVIIQIETGRKHQIRVQMAQMGTPVLGDLRYGASAPLPLRQLALFAHSVTFQHPTRGHPLTVRSPFPLDWPWRGAEQTIDSPHFSPALPGADEEDRRPLWNWLEFSRKLRKNLECW